MAKHYCGNCGKEIIQVRKNPAIANPELTVWIHDWSEDTFTRYNEPLSAEQIQQKRWCKITQATPQT